jgi:lambda family phage portal protein
MTKQPQRRPIYSGISGKLAGAVDAAIGFVLPNVAHSMRKARIKSQALLAYEAANITRLNPVTRSRSADSEILQDIDTLRSAARNLVRDDPHASAMVRTCEDNIVGTGIKPQAAIDAATLGITQEQATAWARACEREWHRWAHADADATGCGTFYDLQRLVLRTRKIDGEAVTHAIVGDNGSKIACEVIDVDRLASPGKVDSSTMRGGVEIDARGKVVAYHIAETHQDDPGGWAAQWKPVRVPKDEGGLSIVQHYFRKERPGQHRGVPDFSSSLTFEKHLHGYLNSEVVAARAASNYALFIKRQVDPTDPDIMPVQPTDLGATAEYHETIEPGTIQYLNEGEEPVPFSPNRPGAQFDQFVTRILRAISSSQGLAYELIAKDFGGMNYSSARAMLLEVRRTFDAERTLLVHQFCRPWWRNVMLVAIASGRLTPPPGFDRNPEAWLQARWLSPTYGWVDPTKEIEASKEAVAANLSTPYDEAARSGLEAESNLEARARFLARAAELEREFNLPVGSLSGVAASTPDVSSDDSEDDDGEAVDDSDDEQLSDPRGAQSEDAATP